MPQAATDLIKLKVVWLLSGEEFCSIPIHAETTILDVKVQLMMQAKLHLDEQRFFAQRGSAKLKDTEHALGRNASRTVLLLLRRDWREVKRSRFSLTRALHLASKMDERHALQLLQRCVVTYPSRVVTRPRGPDDLSFARSRYPKLLSLAWNLEIDEVQCEVLPLPIVFPELRSLKCCLEPPCLGFSRVSGSYLGFRRNVPFRHLRNLELILDDEGNQEGLNPLLPLASSLEVLDIGDFHRNHAKDLKTLENFVELKVLRYSGANQVESGCNSNVQEVLDLRKLIKLEELVFEGTDFTAPHGPQGCSLPAESEMLCSVKAVMQNPIKYMHGGSAGQESACLAQGIFPPAQLAHIIFRHWQMSGITPGLRSFLRAHSCEPLEYLQESVGTPPDWSLLVALQTANEQPLDYEEDKKRSRWHHEYYGWTGRWARWTGDQIENAERRMVEENKRKGEQRKQEQEERRQARDRQRAIRHQMQEQRMTNLHEMPEDPTVCRMCAKRLRRI